METVADAVSSLLGTIHGLLFSPRISVVSSTQEILFSASSHSLSLGTKIEDLMEGLTTGLNEKVILERIHKLQDAIEFSVSAHFLSQYETSEGCPPPTLSLNLDHLRPHLSFFATTAQIIEEVIEKLWEQNAAEMIEEYVLQLFLPEPLKPSPKAISSDMVGLSDQFVEIREKLLAPSIAPRWERKAIWISGMAGIGKTTLARKLFHNPTVEANFESRAFFKVGQDLWRQEILLAITAQLNLDNLEMIVEGDGFFEESFWRILTAKKSLIVLDDVWDHDFVLDLMLKIEGKSNKEDKGSRILITSRSDTYHHHYWDFKMRFMNEEESWELLRREVFGKEEKCPPQLIKPGKKIAKKCEGLPLLITAVASILAQKDLESWNKVAEIPDLVLEHACDQIAEVLLSSYHHIHERLKQCFLYVAAFPQNYTVWCSTIINLWYAEGLLFHSTFAGTEPAEDLIVVKELIDKNLLMSRQKSNIEWNKTKACSLHVAYWYLGRRIAEGNRFLYTINTKADGLKDHVKGHRRLAIYNNVLIAIKEVRNRITSVSTIHSVLCTGTYHQYQVPIGSEWKLLRVLDARTIRFYEFPIEVVKLVRLRYLALTCNANLSPSISRLWDLQYLIVHQHSSIKGAVAEPFVPVEIWDLQELIHLEIMGRNLPDPHPGKALTKLTRLLDVGVESCSRSVFQSLPKLKKLRIQAELAPDVAETSSCFNHISCLGELESFQGVILNPTLLCPPPLPSFTCCLKDLACPPDFPSFSCCLKKLTLSGFGYPWEDINKLAPLHGLTVLKLQCYAFVGEKWEAEGKGFRGVRYLVIEDTDLVQWIAGDETFRALQRLTMTNCHELQEIPRLRQCTSIELVDCNPLAETCANQRYATAERIEITATYSWKDEKLNSRKGTL